MKFPIEIILVVGLSFVGQGCDLGAVFHENSTTAIRSVSEVDMWVVDPDASQGRVLLLPDRLGRIEIIMKDTSMPAVWRLYFHHGESVPPPYQEKEGQLAVLLSGSLDPMGSWPGNHIMVADDKKGTRQGNIPTCMETTKSLPYRKASFLHSKGRQVLREF